MIQTIKVVDNQAPTLDCPAGLVVSTNNGGDACSATVSLPAIGITDACSSFTVETSTPNGTLFSNGGLIFDITLGNYPISYNVVDACGNATSCSFMLTVEDQVAPASICDEITTVTLTSDGTATVDATVFDDGSYDDCCLDYFEVRRMDGDCEGNFDDFGPNVEFCCTDVANNPIMVVFRVYDRDPEPYT